MDNKIKKAILKMVRKSSIFIMANPDAEINVQLMGKHDFGLWFFFGSQIEIVNRPILTSHIESYEEEVDKVLESIKARFLDPKETWIELNTETGNE